MSLNPTHPDDLEAMADERGAIDEEMLFNQKLDAESNAQLEMELHQKKYNPVPTRKENLEIHWANLETEERNEIVEQMMAKTFDPEVPDESFQIALFKRDGDYGWVSFAGIFDSIERVLLYSNQDGRELTVAEAGEECEDGLNLDFFIVNVASEPVEVLYGAKLMKPNTFV